MFRSPPFRKLISRLIIAGTIVLISFPIGVLAYLRTLSPPPPVELANMASLISQASNHETTIHAGDKKITIKEGEILNWLEPYVRNYTGKEDVHFNSAFDAYVLSLSSNLGQAPVDARFIINDGKIVILAAAKNGYEIKHSTAMSEIRRGLIAGKTNVVLSFETVEPAITTDKIASLGINERLAIGESDFTGSSLARIQNIKVASRKYNGLIIKPNETFSFNTILGEVDASGGYAPEKVIKNNKIEYEYGGGICQVSTTLFRAAIAAGFPIVERKPHAFVVSYYGAPGFDATIYPGSSDLRFTNDTKGPVLVQTNIVGKKMFFEIYGKSDGRNVTVNGPYKYDVQADGSMKAYFDRIISFADGASTSKRFTSIYKSPSLYPINPNPYQ